MNLRVLVILQIACVAFLAAAFREGPRAVFPGRLAQPAGGLAAILFLPVLIGFPILVYRAAGRSGLPAWKRGILAGIEATLVYATFLAIWPAVS